MCAAAWISSELAGLEVLIEEGAGDGESQGSMRSFMR